jgi:hypothetical protein
MMTFRKENQFGPLGGFELSPPKVVEIDHFASHLIGIAA